MADTKQTTQDLASEIDEAVAPPDALEPADAKRKFISAGERIHKWSTYLSVDWVFNAMVGVGFAYWGKYSEAGKKIWSGPITKRFESVLGKVIKDKGALEKSVEYGNIFMSIIAGGMFTIPPLLVLENNKIRKKIISFYDRIIYGKDAVNNDPKFEQAYKEIEQTPKKDFWNGLWARGAALSPLLAMVLIPASKEKVDEYWFHRVAGWSKSVAGRMGFSVEKLAKTVPLKDLKVGESQLSEAKERWKFIHASVAMDLGLGIPYAVMHAFFYNLFTGNKNQASQSSSTTTPPVTAPALESLSARDEIPQIQHAAREAQRRAVAADASATQSYGVV